MIEHHKTYSAEAIYFCPYFLFSLIFFLSKRLAQNAYMLG